MRANRNISNDLVTKRFKDYDTLARNILEALKGHINYKVF